MSGLAAGVASCRKGQWGRAWTIWGWGRDVDLNFNQWALVLAVFVPTVGAFLLPLVSRISTRLRSAMAFLLVATALGASLALLPAVLSGADITLRYSVPLGSQAFDFVFQADRLAVFMALVSSLISAIIVLYSTGYIAHYDYQEEYYLMVVLFLGAMMGLVYSGSLILLYVFWEITGIASWRLIGFFREKHHVLRADKAFLVTVFGAVAMLLGFVALYVQTGTFDMAAMKSALHGQALPGLVVALILAGILSKSATLPLHTWLPDAGVAPSPVTALLHAAVLVKIGVYVFARLFIVNFDIGPEWQTVVLWIAAASALVSAGAAMIDTDLKRIIAYSTVSQIAFIFLGLASGSSIGVAGGLLYILMHGIAKGGLFLCAGIIEHGTHTKDITKMGGLAKTMPVTAVAFLFCAFSVMGIPPFGGFFSKYMVMWGAVEGGQWVVALVFLVGACMTILYLLRVFKMVFLGEAKTPAGEGSPIMVASVALLAAMALASGILVTWPSEFAQKAVEQMNLPAVAQAAIDHVQGMVR
jgi:NADH:ubiquinone oxidoreductase subunit 5 (subunit L)/multisubunit Na+/H+ antiporter MnhA subunit